jgi:AbrB family looped-hinge helix DNA binding protein
MPSTATMTSKGQITIPADVRAKFRLRPGTRIDFAENAAGELVMRPKTGDIRALRGFIKYDGPQVSIDEMDRGIAEAVAERLKRCD